jgi:Skp family chaperone for outer membrane proteins
MFGWARKAKDWLLGMDDLPAVKAIFERNRTIFVNTINQLVENISADNKRVIQECKDELARAKKDIKDYVDKLGPDLKNIGKQAAEEMNGKLNELDRTVAKKEQELQDSLKDKQQAAIKAIDEKIEKMKEAMSGALAKLGKLLLWAAKKFFTWALEKFGFSLSEIENIINKGAAVLKAIFTKPIQFVKNLVKAASEGFKNFGKNFLKHLQDAVFEWLTGSLTGLILPSSWDLKGILSVVFQMLGLTYQNIRAHLVRLIPEPAVKALETSFTLVKTLITEGPLAAWEQLKDMAGEMKEAFITAIKDWIKWQVVQKAIETILSMFIPGAGIIRAIIGIYDTIVFFIQRAKDIMKMIGSFLGSIAEIAAGNIGAAAEALEKGLARGLVLVIDFLARFLRLSGITAKIREAIQKIRAKVDNVIERVAKWVVDKGKHLLSAVQSGASKILGGDPTAPSAERIGKALREAVPVVNRYAGRPVGAVILRPLLMPIKLRHRLSRLDVVPQGNVWAVEAAASPTVTALTTAQVPGSGIAGLTSQIRYTSGNLVGRTVGQEMVADPLGPDHPMGQEPAGENIWRNILVTDPEQSNDRKYIRGHLLNHQVGGTGAAQNLFPITATANDSHESQIESRVKRWVNTERKWVYYRVHVANINAVVNPAGPIVNNRIDAQFVCTASVIDTTLPLTPANRHNTISATIVSHYRPPAGSAAVINQSGPAQERAIAARPADLAANVAVPAGEEYRLDQTLYRDLQTITVTKGLGTRHIDQAIQDVTGLGPAITSTLYKAFELSLNNQRGDIGSHLNTSEKSNLTRLNNKSTAIHTALRLWL